MNRASCVSYLVFAILAPAFSQANSGDTHHAQFRTPAVNGGGEH